MRELNPQIKYKTKKELEVVSLSPWEESSEAFPLGVHLILFRIIRMSLWIPKILFFI